MAQPNDADAAKPAPQPPLNWRFEFATYRATRDFLDLLADMSKRDDYYPNINFGKTYVNVSMDAEGKAALGTRADAFIEEMKALATRGET